MCISSESYFINDRVGDNKRKPGDPGIYEPHGVVTQVGSKKKCEGVMKYQDCVINQYQYVKDKGYGCEEMTTLPGIWSCFCNSELPTWNEAHEVSNILKVLSEKKVNIVC